MRNLSRFLPGRVPDLPVLLLLLLPLLLPVGTAAPCAAGSLRLVSEDGQSHLRVGVLAQMRAEGVEADGADRANDIYLRRLRLLAAGQLSPGWTFFLETDSPNLGHSRPDGAKEAGDMYIQDFVVSWAATEAVTLDLGLILMPVSRNANQSAAALMTLDYGPWSFVSAGPLDARVGRDYGALVRAFPAQGRLEFRGGVFQGKRGADATNDPRAVVRLGYNVVGAETGLFYTATTLGASRRLAFGLSGDVQESYRGASADFIWDEPFGGGQGLTLQVVGTYLDGRDLAPEVVEQRILHSELGLYLGETGFQPFTAYSRRNLTGRDGNDEQLEVGLAWYLAGRSRVLKAAWAHRSQVGADDLDFLTLQLQIFHL